MPKKSNLSSKSPDVNEKESSLMSTCGQRSRPRLRCRGAWIREPGARTTTSPQKCSTWECYENS